jgi:hypothetical protein
MATPSKSAYNMQQALGVLVCSISRLNYKDCDILPFKCISPIANIKPIAISDPQQAFDDIMLARATELKVESEQLNKPLRVMWSGGLDSTGLVLALREVGANPIIYMSTTSIKENSSMFYDVITKYDFKFLGGGEFDNGLLVSGECGDQLFGSDMMVKMAEEDLFSADFKSAIYKAHPTNRLLAKRFIELYEPIIKECPQPIETTAQFFWWWNFSQKWQYVTYQYLTNFPNLKTNLETWRPFFNTNDFQAWAIAAPSEYKIRPGALRKTYKWAMRQFITKYGKFEYSDIPKRGSLYAAMIGNPFNVGAIDEDWNPVDRSITEAELRPIWEI